MTSRYPNFAIQKENEAYLLHTKAAEKHYEEGKQEYYARNYDKSYLHLLKSVDARARADGLWAKNNKDVNSEHFFETLKRLKLWEKVSKLLNKADNCQKSQWKDSSHTLFATELREYQHHKEQAHTFYDNARKAKIRKDYHEAYKNLMKSVDARSKADGLWAKNNQKCDSGHAAFSLKQLELWEFVSQQLNKKPTFQKPKVVKKQSSAKITKPTSRAAKVTRANPKQNKKKWGYSQR